MSTVQGESMWELPFDSRRGNNIETNKKLDRLIELQEEANLFRENNLKKYKIGRIYKDKEGREFKINKDGFMMTDYGNGFD